jgi:hypothetical protein
MAKNIFRNNSGTRYLNALFYETTGMDKSTVVYTLKDKTHEGYPSLKEKYLSCEDLTEYSFAINYLDGWEHWQMLCNCSWFEEYLLQWRGELHERLRSKALNTIKSIAESGEKDALAANKYLLEYLKGDGKRPVGRPKAHKEAKSTRADTARVDDDYARIVKGVGLPGLGMPRNRPETALRAV